MQLGSRRTRFKPSSCSSKFPNSHNILLYHTTSEGDQHDTQIEGIQEEEATNTVFLFLGGDTDL